MTTKRQNRSARGYHSGTMQLVLIGAVAAGAVGALSGCTEGVSPGSDPNDQVVQLQRAKYESVEQCIQDWGDPQNCEPAVGAAPPDETNWPIVASASVIESAASAPLAVASSASSSEFNTSGFNSGGGGATAAASTTRVVMVPQPITWWGPYYSQSGHAYLYDGRVASMQSMPQHAAGFASQQTSLNKVYGSSAGRYANTAAHPRAASVKSTASSRSFAMSRGGFGSSGRGGFSSGG